MSPPKREIVPFPTDSNSSDLSTPPLAPQILRRRQNVSLACSECRVSRKKCSGGPPPCRSCDLAGLECRFDPNSDARRNANANQKRDSDVNYHDFADSLLRVIRSCTLASCDHVLGVIRQGSPLRDIASAVESALRQLDSQALPERPSRKSRRPGAMEVENLVHVPRLAVPASPWTSVVPDDEIISELMTLYFTWCHPFLQIVDRDSFIEDMKAGKLESPFASKFLVNAILALGCHFYDEEDPRESDHSTTKHSEGFYMEAKRLWEEQNAKASLANVQGLCALTLESFFRGRDRVAWMMLGMTNHIYQEMRLDIDKGILINSESPMLYHRLLKSTRTTALTLFCLNMVISNALLKPIMAMAPDLSKIEASQHTDDEIEWWAFPSPRHSRPLPISSVLEAQSSLAKLQAGCLSLLFDNPDWTNLPKLFSSVETKYQTLQQWRAELSGNLQLGDQPAPAIIDLHLTYSHIILILFSFFDSPKHNRDEQNWQYTARARARIIDAALEIGHLCSTYRRLYTLRRVTITVLQSANIAAHCLLSYLHDARTTSVLATLCQILAAARGQWIIAKGFVLMLEPTASHLGIQLPDEVLKVLQQNEPNMYSWHTGDASLFNSTYPNYSILKAGDEDISSEMGELLRRWEGLSPN